MRKRRFLSVLTIVSFLITFVTPITTGTASPLSSAGYYPNHATAKSRLVSPENDIARLGASASRDKMLQFRAGGHVLGFRADKAYLAGMDHVLSVEFLGTAGVMPIAESAHTTQPLMKFKHGTERIFGAQPLSRVTYQNLWEGVSLTYSSTNSGITESTYHIEPYADVSKIRLRYNVPVKMQKNGSLKLTFSSGFLTESAPVAWQEIEGKRVPVEVSFMVSKNEIGFSVGKYESKFPLTIDPAYQWHTFYGSAQPTGVDQGYGIAVDGSGNVYVTGFSGATWDGPGPTSPIHPFGGGSNIFVLKLDSSGAYQWHTFYGAANGNKGYGIAVDSGGNVYVTGYSGAAWTGPSGESPEHAYGSGNNVFVLKLDSSGAYQWHTFYGATGNEYGYGIVLDGSGNVNVAGYSRETWNGSSGELPKHAYSGGDDIFVLKLDSSGAYQWHTFYGSAAGDDDGYGIAVDGTNNVYVTGYSEGSWNGPGGELPENSYGGGGGDVFVLKLDSSGAYQWHTFYGAAADYDEGLSIAVDGSGNIYVTGDSYGTWDGPGPTSPIHPFGGGSNIFVLKLDSSGVYQWHTFYGAAADNVGFGIAVDGTGNVYVTGQSGATWDGDSATSPIHAYSGGIDIFVLKLDSSGAYQWHTFYGAAGNEYSRGMAVSSSSNIYVTGDSYDTWNGPGGESPIHAYSGNDDIFVLKTSDMSGPPSPASVPTMNEWGMIIFAGLAGLGAVYYLRRQKRAES